MKNPGSARPTAPTPLIRAAISAIVALTSLAACSTTDRDEVSSVTVRDSVGIRIVENGPLPLDAPSWETSGPTLEIGTLDGDAEYQLFQIRGAVRLPDGRVVVANAGSHELRWYGPDGDHIRSVGSEGEGPGEFTGISFLARFGDSLLVYDRRQTRATIFDLEGALIRSNQIEGARFPGVTGVFGDGSVLAAGDAPMEPTGGSGVVRRDALVRLFDPNGVPVHEFGTFSGQESYISITADMAMVARFTGARSFQSSVVADRIVMGSTDQYEFRRYDRTGAVRSIVRLDRPQVAMTHQDYQAVKAQQLESVSEEGRARFAEFTEAQPEPETLPSFSRIMGDATGSVWIEDVLHPQADHQQWTVFNLDGTALNRIRFGKDFRLHEVGVDYVLGVATDELDVERLQLWRLERPAPLDPAESSGS